MTPTMSTPGALAAVAAAADSPPVDRLAAIFSRVHVRARVFHTGRLHCSVAFPAASGPGHVHVLRAGRLRVEGAAFEPVALQAPAAVLLPRANAHTLGLGDGGEAELVCAEVDLGGPGNPLEQGLPPLLSLPLVPGDGLDRLLALLFEEAGAHYCGRQAALDRLAELVLIHMLRHLMESRATSYGLLAGLAHPTLRRALTGVHEDPGGPWTLEAMAEAAGMSRSVFAETFRQTVGVSPGEYLIRWRLSLARAALMAGKSVKTVAREVGYDSPAAFSRAFSRHFGTPARDVGRVRRHDDA